MELLELMSTKYNQIVPSIPFMILHSTSISYYVTKQPKQSLFSLLVATFVLGFGGGILTSMFLGTPMLFFYDHLVLSLYSLTTIIMARSGVFLLIDINFKQIQPLFVLVDALARAYVMPSFLVDFRMSQPSNYSGKDSLLGQLILTVVYVTGGGYLFSWCFKRQEFDVKGWFVRVIAFASLVLIILFDIIEANNGTFWYPARQWLVKNRVDVDAISMEHIQFFTACIVAIGFLTRPDIIDDDIEDDYVFVSHFEDYVHEENDFVEREQTEDTEATQETEETQTKEEKGTRKRRSKAPVPPPETPRRSTRSRKE